jgi:ATP-binding cassette subfamily F protein uup
MRGAKARTTKQKARIQRAEALIAAEPTQSPAQLELEALELATPRTGKTVIDLLDVTLKIAGRPLVSGLTLHLKGGERIGVVGPNGIGKTTLLKAVAAELEPDGGTIARGTQTRIAHFDQTRAALRDDWSILDNVAEREDAARLGAGVVALGERTLEMRTYLEYFLFDGAKQRQKVGSLSGGERARVALAKILKSGANLLLLDEPTNDLDVATLSSLEELLSAWPGSALIVSHDR